MWILAEAGAGLVVAAFVLSALVCEIVRRLAPRVGLVDKPGGRKAHRAPTPLGGGVAIWLTTGLVLAAGAVLLRLNPDALPEALRQHANGLWVRSGELAWIMGLASLVMLMGLCDDRFGL